METSRKYILTLVKRKEKEEREALGELILGQKEGKIVIQPADKGSGWCILDRSDYISEGERQLNAKLTDENGSQTNYYKKVNENLVKKQHSEIRKFLTESKDAGHIDKNLAKNLLPDDPKAGALYLTPKIHKPDSFYEAPSGTKIPKGRPIVSGCGSNTERNSWFVDKHLKESVKKM